MVLAGMALAVIGRGEGDNESGAAAGRFLVTDRPAVVLHETQAER